MVNVSTLADGAVASIKNIENVQCFEKLVNCANLNAGYKVNPGLTKLTAAVVYAIGIIPGGSIIRAASLKTVKAEGGAATVSAFLKTVGGTPFSAVMTLTAGLDGNSVGDADYWVPAAGGSTDGYVPVDSYVCISSSADLDLAKIHVSVDYKKSDFSLVNE